MKLCMEVCRNVAMLSSLVLPNHACIGWNLLWFTFTQSRGNLSGNFFLRDVASRGWCKDWKN